MNKKNKSTISILGILLLLAFLTFTKAYCEENVKFKNNNRVLKLTLEECINIALKKNHYRPASKFALEMAKAQHQQAMSSYWPQVSANVGLTRMDEAPNFIFPSRTFNIPSYNVTIPANSFAPGFPPTDTQLPVPASQFTLPEQNVKLINRDLLTASIDFKYPLYMGGIRQALVKQAENKIKMAQQDSRRTDLKIILDVKKMYYSLVLAQKLHKIGDNALRRMRATLEITETFYKGSSTKVKKTDYLRNKMVVETLEAIIIDLKNNEKLAQAALANNMGLDWKTKIIPSTKEIPYKPYNTQLSHLICNAYVFNPDWLKLEAALKALEAKISEAKGNHLPKIAIIGKINYFANSYKYGLATSINKNSWNIGLGMEFPIFNGFLTKHKIKEAQAHLKEVKHKQIILKEGVALQVKHAFLEMQKTQNQQKFTQKAAQTAWENMDLNTRAYRNELVETKDVIESQVQNSLIKAQYQKVLYDHIIAQINLDYIIGNEVRKILEKNTTTENSN